MRSPDVSTLVFVLAVAGGSLPTAASLSPSEPLSGELADAVWGPLAALPADEIETVKSTCGEAAPLDCGALALHYSRAAARLADQPRPDATVYRLACADGFPWACYLLAELARQGPADRLSAALALHDRACARGERRACLALGEMYEQGEGTAADSARAEEIFNRECDRSRSAACWRLGQLLDRQGDRNQMLLGRLQDATRRACAGGIGAACFQLAEVLAETDAGESAVAYYYGQACDRRHPRGCLRYAERLETGTGAEVDLSLAASLFDQACDSGLPEACLRLASLYRAGRGVLRNPIVARALEDEACRLGLRLACKPQ